jgi:hypothetical protein
MSHILVCKECRKHWASCDCPKSIQDAVPLHPLREAKTSPTQGITLARITQIDAARKPMPDPPKDAA